MYSIRRPPGNAISGVVLRQDYQSPMKGANVAEGDVVAAAGAAAGGDVKAESETIEIVVVSDLCDLDKS